MSISEPGPEVDLIEHAAKIIVEARKNPHTAPYHWAGALREAGMLVPPGHSAVTDSLDRRSWLEGRLMSLRIVRHEIPNQPDKAAIAALVENLIAGAEADLAKLGAPA